MKTETIFRLEVSDQELRTRLLEEIRELRYPPDGGDLVDKIAQDFAERLRATEHAILDELVAAKQIGLGLGPGPGGGSYSYTMLDQITPQFVRDIISESEGRTFYDLEPYCWGTPGEEAAHLFLNAWKKAIADGLKQRLFFRHQHHYYTDEAQYLKAKTESATRKQNPTAVV